MPINILIALLYIYISQPPSTSPIGVVLPALSDGGGDRELVKLEPVLKSEK